MYKPDSIWTWSFLGVALVQAIIVLALEAYSFAIFQEDVGNVNIAPNLQPYTRAVPVVACVYLFGVLYFLILVWDSLRQRNTIQVIGLCLGNLCLMVFGASEPKQVIDSISTLNLAAYDADIYHKLTPPEATIPVVLFFGTIIMSFIARKLYDEFSWSIYKHISADLQMKRRYLTYQIYIALIKFDFYFFLGFAMQLLVVVVHYDGDPEFWLTVAAIPVVVFVLLVSSYWVRGENTAGMVVVIIIYVAGLVYYFFKLVRIWSGDKTLIYVPVNKPLTIFAIITIILIVATIVVAIQCTMNFKKGLKPYLQKSRGASDEEKTYNNTEMPSLGHQQYAQQPTRMTIE